MRIFAGPNGSGKSTIIQSVKDFQTARGEIQLGTYINADDLVTDLKAGTFNFSKYKIAPTLADFEKVAIGSGLLNEKFPLSEFSGCYTLSKGRIILNSPSKVEHLAQVLAHFLRNQMLRLSRKFSFETVFSHPGKLEIMREANQRGYKVYLYFVSTNSPEINKDRVKLRVEKNGHYVKPALIESRYYRTMDLLYDAAQLSYQTYFWDNSGEQPRLFTYFKVINGKKEWKKININEAPDWFIRYYAEKVRQ